MKKYIASLVLTYCVTLLCGVVAFMAVLTGRPAVAGDLLIGQRTHHFAKYMNADECGQGTQWQCEKFNDSQELIGYASDKWAIIYMHQNSVREKSLILVRTYKYDLTDNLRPFAAVGLATGYSGRYEQYSMGEVTPMGYFGLDIHPKSDRVGMLVTWQPESFIGLGSRITF